MTPLALLCVVVLSQAKVTQVVVYPDRALVTRSAPLRCGGRQRLEFPGIPPSADPSTIRAKGIGAAVESVRAEERPRKEVLLPLLQELEKKIQGIESERATLRAGQAEVELTARQARAFAQVAQQLVGREMVQPSPNLRGFKGAFDTALAASLGAVRASRELRAKVREVEKRLQELADQRARLQAASARMDHVAEVLATCAQGPAHVELSYLVGGASWEVGYEARAQPGAKLVELTALATVRQSSGEDWSDVQLIVSTAIPRQNATPPALSPLKVWADEHRPEKKVLVRREEAREHAEEGGAGTADGAGLSAKAQGLSVQLSSAERGDVPSDGSPVRFAIGTYRLKAEQSFQAHPALAPNVFRVAQLINSAPFPLLGGPLDVFGEHGLIGRSSLEHVPQGGAFRITFGVEESFKLSRITLTEQRRETGLFNHNRRFSYGYRLEVENHRGRAEELSLSERIPVSELQDIRVELENSTTPGFEHLRDDGIVRWRFKLGAGQRKTLQLSFHVDVPQSYDSSGLP